MASPSGARRQAPGRGVAADLTPQTSRFHRRRTRTRRWWSRSRWSWTNCRTCSTPTGATAAGDPAGHGHLGQGRHHPRRVWPHERAGRAHRGLEGAQRGRARARLPLAHPPAGSAGGRHHHLQPPQPLRGRAGARGQWLDHARAAAPALWPYQRLRAHAARRAPSCSSSCCTSAATNSASACRSAWTTHQALEVRDERHRCTQTVGQYQHAYEQLLAATHTPWAPWTIAGRLKTHRNLMIATVLREVLRNRTCYSRRATRRWPTSRWNERSPLCHALLCIRCITTENWPWTSPTPAPKAACLALSQRNNHAEPLRNLRFRRNHPLPRTCEADKLGPGASTSSRWIVSPLPGQPGTLGGNAQAPQGR